MVVRCARCDDQFRSLRKTLEVAQHVLPLPLRQVAFRENNVHPLAIEEFHRTLPVASFHQLPPGLLTDVFQQGTVGRKFADGQDTNGILLLLWHQTTPFRMAGTFLLVPTLPLGLPKNNRVFARISALRTPVPISNPSTKAWVGALLTS